MARISDLRCGFLSSWFLVFLGTFRCSAAWGRPGGDVGELRPCGSALAVTSNFDRFRRPVSAILNHVPSTEDSTSSESLVTEQAYEPSITPENYITDRLEQYQGWYDKKAVKMKANHLRIRVVSVGGGITVPALVNLPFSWATVVVTIVSLIVACSVSLDSVFKYREQWKNYRSTEQLLGHEKVYFRTRTGAYEGLDEATAFRNLVERVEGAIAAENSATLNVMTTAQQVTEPDYARYAAAAS
ncbi:DUF4231 domain-containing protein [Nocardia kruczakiae]|uniref:DUF4231 domain-containing protein n=1 Tax=Nocardia kruczakiae TaxID=261477 RepID=UPI0009FC7E40|nr:DUF4231 domain-containing protein [Nocardia kruczakiae]